MTIAKSSMRFEARARFLELPKVIDARLQALGHPVERQSSGPMSSAALRLRRSIARLSSTKS